MVSLLSVPEEAEIRRGAYIAVLRAEVGALETRGRFAERIRTSRIYIEQLLREGGNRTPGPEISRTIVQSLPLDPERRDDLLMQMQLAAQRRLNQHRASIGATSSGQRELRLAQLREAHWVASYAASPTLAGERYRELCAIGERLLLDDELRRDTLAAIEVCLILHDAWSVLNRPGQALVHAKTAGKLVSRFDSWGASASQERIAHVRVNAPVAEAASLISLGLAKQAEERLAWAIAVMAKSPAAVDFWKPHIMRSQLAALGERNRFTLGAAEGLALAAKAFFERRAGILDRQFALQADLSLARAYLRYGSSLSQKKAFRLLRGPIESLDTVPELGAVKRSIALKTFADACYATGRLDEGADYLTRAWTLAQQAGLTHQMASMRRQRRAELRELGLSETMEL